MNGQAEPDALARFLADLRGDGCDGRHVEKIIERIRAERAAADAAAARVFFNGSPSKPLPLLALADELRDLRCKAMTLELAISGACAEGRVDTCGEALATQASELSRAMERFERAFTAELHMIRVDNQASE